MRYFKNRGGLPADDAADVVIYRGSPVGAGPDNEPLVMPHAFPRPFAVKPSEFERMVSASPKR